MFWELYPPPFIMSVIIGNIMADCYSGGNIVTITTIKIRTLVHVHQCIINMIMVLKMLNTYIK